jgi:hypothetical protein
MVNPARFDAAVFAALRCASRMSDPIERFVPDPDDEGGHTAGGQAHFTPTIRAGGHGLEGSSPF